MYSLLLLFLHIVDLVGHINVVSLLINTGFNSLSVFAFRINRFFHLSFKNYTKLKMDSRHEFSDTYSDTSSEDEEAYLEEESRDWNKNIHTKFGRDNVLHTWDQVYILVYATGLFVDPLFFYALSISDSWLCVFIDGWFAITVTVARCMTDVLHVTNMWLQFKWNRWSQYDVGSYNVAGKGFLFDLFVILPIPQVYLRINYKNNPFSLLFINLT